MNSLTYRLGLLAVAVGLTLAWPVASSAQNLYAASFGNTIQSYTPDGAVTQFASTGLNGPFGLAFDTAGNLYAANAGNSTIEEFATDGTNTQFAALSSPYGLAFQAPVPKPFTWAAVFAGAGLLGFVTLRQRRCAAARA